MKKKTLQRIAAVLVLGLVLVQSGEVRAVSTPMEDRIRVGLSYGSGAAAGANLLNSEGRGYRLGYFDSERQFVELGRTEETAISVVKTQNVWYGPLPGSSTLRGYSDQVESSIGVGCYHIQLPEVYETFEEASEAAAQLESGFVAWIEETYRVRTGAYMNAEEANAALEELRGQAEPERAEGIVLAGTSSYGVSVVQTGSSRILFQFDGGAKLPLGISPGLEEEPKPVTWYAGKKYFGDFRYERIDGGNLTVVNIVDREDYINCVISQEMSDSWPLEALKAQAVAARSYAAATIGKHTAYGFDLCGTIDCQAYSGMSRIGSNTTRAAAETSGVYVWYQGKIAEAVYAASDGGATDDAKNIWGSNVGYLMGTEDPWEAMVENRISQYRWSYTYGPAELERVAERLRSGGRNCGTLVDIRVAAVTAMGNVRSVTFTDDTGTSWTLSSGDRCRTTLNLPSCRYTITGGSSYSVNEDGSTLSSVIGAYAVDGDGNVIQVGGTPYVITADGMAELELPEAKEGNTFTISGTGKGHNVGMSQWGAYSMAQQGKTYEEILKFYYTGVEIR